MTKDEIAALAERVCRERPTVLQVRLMLEQAASKADADWEKTYTEQRVKDLEQRLDEAGIILSGYADEAAKGAVTCEHCRMIVAMYEVPRG